MRHARTFAGIALLGLANMVAAQASVDLSAFPTMSLADGHSTVTISATIRLPNGSLAPDGTRVVFSTDRGSFRQSVVETRNGVARAVMQTGTEAGFAKVTATVLSYRATATMDYEYVSDRSLLNSANEFIIIDAEENGTVRYSMDFRVAEAEGPGRVGVVKFRDVTIKADRIQVNIPTYEVRAKNAVITIGKEEPVECSELYFRLNTRLGYGLTNFTYKPRALEPYGNGFRFVEGESRTTYGVAEIRPGTVREPVSPVRSQLFEMRDLDESVTIIKAASLTAFPRKDIHIQKADVLVGGARVLSTPLYKISVFTSTPVFTDQILKINNNQLAVDYPHYLSLTPTSQSALRLQMGNGGSGRGLTSTNGVFLNYEMNWNRGDEFQGDMVVNGLGRNDWGIGIRQFWRPDTSTDISAQLDFPAHSALFGNLNLNKQLAGGYSFTTYASDSRSIRGAEYSSQQVSASLEKNPVPVGKLPVYVSYGLTASSLHANYGTYKNSQESAGLRTSFRMNPIYLDRNTSVTSSFTLSKLFGQNVPGGLSQVGNLTINRNLNGGGLSLSYDYFADGFTDTYLGSHQLSARANMYFGNLMLNSFFLKSLDQDRYSVQADASFRINRDMRLSYAYTFDRVFGGSYMDYYFVLGYRLGYREFGLTWSQRTKRFGFQLLGTTFN